MKRFLIRSEKKVIKGISLIMAIALISTFIGIPLIKAKADISNQPSFEIRIDSATPNPAIVGEDIEIKGTITPKDFQAGINSQKKEIVLVLDVSGSMNDDVSIKCTNKRERYKVESGYWQYYYKNYKRWIDTSYYIDDYCEEHHKVGEHQIESTKIGELKKAGNNFLTKMSEISNLKIGIVAYSSEATINPTLVHYNYNKYGNSYNYDIKKSYSVSEKTYSYIPNYISLGNVFLDANGENIKRLKGMVDGLESLGGTNTGEGLRKAEYMLEKGDKEANKSIVFMSDGLPTFCSVTANYDYYTTIDSANPSCYGTGNSDKRGYCKEYAEKIGKIIKEKKSNVFSIGYGLDNNGNNTMGDIHNSMGGLEKNFFATDVGAIAGVFDAIADEIINSYTIDSLSMNMNFNSDDGFSLNVDGNTVKLNSIVYTREEKANANGNWIYKAEPVNFKFIIKGSKSGEYNNVFKNSTTKFLWQGSTIDGLTIQNGLIIKINDNSIPVIKANIINQNPNPAMQSNNISITCQVKPESFEFNRIINDDSIFKDVVFALDISKSNKSNGAWANEEEKVKEVENALIDRLKNSSEIKNARYGMVTYSNAVYDSFSLREAQELAENIKKLATINNGASQIKFGEDEANKNLSSYGRDGSKRYVVIISSGHGSAKHKIENDVSNGAYNRITLNLADIDSVDELRNTEIPFIFDQIKNTTEQRQVPSYTFKTKLKFNLEGKFDSISGLNLCSDKGYDVETPEFDVIYNLKDGKYVPETVDLKFFTVKIKNISVTINNLNFSSGAISYTDLANKLRNNSISSYPLNLKSQISILKHGLYEGIKNNEPSILDKGNEFFELEKGGSANLGATMFGTINNDTNVRLEIPKELEITNTIKVFIYDDSNGKLTPIGIMEKSSSNDSNIIYKYNGQEVLDKKILILYNEKLPQNPKKNDYINSLYVPDGSQKDVKIKITQELPDLF